jgi:hypothetical protein
MDDSFLNALEELMKNLVDNANKNWVQIGKLSPEDFLKFRGHNKDADQLNVEYRAIVSKAKAIQAQAKALGDEWWAYLHKRYSIPENANLTIKDDGVILMQPKEKKS